MSKGVTEQKNIMEVNPTLQTDKSQRDYELVCKAREQGDERAYADLMRYYRDSIYTMLLRMTGDPVIADDLTMEAFSKAFTSLKKYVPTHAFSTWLFTIACNNCVDFIRKRHIDTIPIGKLSVHNDNNLHEEQFLTSTDDNPEENMVRTQRIAMLRDVVNQLKPRYRVIVELRYFEDLSYEEISDQLGLPIGTVKARLFRAKDLLHGILINSKEAI